MLVANCKLRPNRLSTARLLVEVLLPVHFQCCVDLKNNVLKIGTTGNEATFLSEADLKDKELLERQQAVSSTAVMCQ